MFDIEDTKYVKDTPELRKKYYISEENSAANLQEVQDIINIRRQLYKLIVKYNEVFNDKVDIHNPNHIFLDEIIDDVMAMAQTLKDYMQSSNKDNIMNRLVFINNFKFEFADMAEIANMNPIYDKDIEESLKPIEEFLRYISASTLVENGRLNKLQDELAEENVSMFASLVKTKYVSYMEDPMSQLDLYLMYGYILKEYETKDKEIPKACVGCQKDDCSYCSDYSTFLNYDKEAQNYRDIRDALYNKMLNPNYHNYRVTKFNLSNIWLSEKLDALLNGSLSSKEKAVHVKSNKVGKIRLQKDKMLDKIDEKVTYKDIKNMNSDMYAYFFLKKFFDFQNDEGMNIDKDFREWYSAFVSQLDQNGHIKVKNKESDVAFNKLIDTYQIKIKKNEQPGGND